MYGTLEGLLVVALEQAVAGPLASAKLADAGARVIKVERAGGDFARAYDHAVHGESAYFVWLNRGKESAVLDIKAAEDAQLLRRMIGGADVLIQNLAPGATERSDFGSVEMRKLNPRLVTCDISGYGEDGPCSHMKAYDNLLQGETGLIAVTGQPNAPAKVGISIADISAGVQAFAAILEALLRREQTGNGVGIKISLFDCLADWMSVPYLHQVYRGEPPRRSGLHHASIAPYGPYRSRDGRQVIIAIQNEREWANFCRVVLQRPDLTDDEGLDSNSRRVANRARLNAILEPAVRGLSLEVLVARLEEARVAYGRLNSVDEFARHPHLRLMEVDTPSGPVALPAPPVRFEPGPSAPTTRAAVPALGEHTAALRREFAENGRGAPADP